MWQRKWATFSKESLDGKGWLCKTQTKGLPIGQLCQRYRQIYVLLWWVQSEPFDAVVLASILWTYIYCTDISLDVLQTSNPFYFCFTCVPFFYVSHPPKPSKTVVLTADQRKRHGIKPQCSHTVLGWNSNYSGEPGGGLSATNSSSSTPKWGGGIFGRDWEGGNWGSGKVVEGTGAGDHSLN